MTKREEETSACHISAMKLTLLATLALSGLTPAFALSSPVVLSTPSPLLSHYYPTADSITSDSIISCVANNSIGPLRHCGYKEVPTPRVPNSLGRRDVSFTIEIDGRMRELRVGEGSDVGTAARQFLADNGVAVDGELQSMLGRAILARASK